VGTPAHLLDDVTHLQETWLDGVETVLITAGASAPEHLVLEIVDHLVKHHDGELQDESTIDEGMSFSIPPTVTSFLELRNITVEGKSK
jgi:4-hydroxy-3-methylbut-2-enyl diphosphate reductase